MLWFLRLQSCGFCGFAGDANWAYETFPACSVREEERLTVKVVFLSDSFLELMLIIEIFSFFV